MAERRNRLSIPARIVLSFVLVLLAFGSVATASLVQHQRTAEQLRLLHEGYLPLAITIGQAKATETVFATLLDRLPEERGATTRGWLNAARRVRPTTLRRALAGVERAERLDPPEQERAVLRAVRSRLGDVSRTYAASDTRFEALYQAMEAGDERQVAALLGSLRTEQQRVVRALRDAWSRVQGQIAETSSAAAEGERRSVVEVALLALIALLVGLVLTWWSQRLLAPLPRLHQRVLAVAQGDLSSGAEEPKVHRNDELGRLALEFERMVAALAARDQELHEATDRLIHSERLAAIGRMAAHVTHEVRNPLSSIGLNVEMLGDEIEAGDAEEARALLSAIHKEIDRLTGITEEYLRLARLPAPRFGSEPIGEIAAEVAAFLAPEMEAAGLRFSVEIEEELPAVAADEGQIRQALMNLLRNAREAMAERSPEELQEHPSHVLFSVRAQQDEQEGAGLAIRIEDRGPGIPEARRARIFDLFYSTKERGSGLGLPLTQQIVLAHRGRIECTDAPEGGTLFSIWLPAGSPETEDGEDGEAEELRPEEGLAAEIKDEADIAAEES